MCANTGAGVRLLHLHLHHWNVSPSNSHVREVPSQLWPESRNRGLTAIPFHVKAHSATLSRPRASGVLSSAKETRIVADEHVAHQGVSGLFQRLQTPRSAEKRTPVTVLRLITFRGGLHGEKKRTRSRSRSVSPTHVTKMPTTSALSQN